MGLLHLARLTTPAMLEAGEGALIVTGNTSALRGRAKFAGFAPTKAAQRILAESMARELGPKGVHVAYIVIDAVIDVPRDAASSEVEEAALALPQVIKFLDGRAPKRVVIVPNRIVSVVA